MKKAANHRFRHIERAPREKDGVMYKYIEVELQKRGWFGWFTISKAGIYNDSERFDERASKMMLAQDIFQAELLLMKHVYGKHE